MNVVQQAKHSRSYEGLRPGKPLSEGHATLNVNEWLKYFNARSNPIDLIAGTSYIIKIRPIQHVSSPRIKDLDISKRECRFKEEKGMS